MNMKVVDTTVRDIEEITAEELAENYTSINDATVRLGFKHAQYTRRLVIEGKLDAIKVQHAHFQKWHIHVDSINGYEKNARNLKSRRYVMRFAKEDEAKVRAALEAANIEYSLELQYQKKDK